MITLLDLNGNKIKLHNAAFQEHFPGKTNYYNNSAKEKWVATLFDSGVIAVTSEASYTIEKATKINIENLISELDNFNSRYRINVYHLSVLKSILNKFNSKKKEWQPGLEKVNF